MSVVSMKYEDYMYMLMRATMLETALSRDRLACLAPPDTVFNVGYDQDPEVDNDPGLIILLNSPQRVHDSLALLSVVAGLRMLHNVPLPAVTLQQGN